MNDRHLSSQFDEDLNSLSSKLLQMGGMVESQIEICHARILRGQY